MMDTPRRAARIWVAASLAMIAATLAPRPANAQQSEDASKGFAVIELFTSQGCNSCPPADKLLGEISQWAKTAERDVYCLSFHVDYWNYLGWEDPYSHADFTKRQRQYATLLKQRNVYTPQMIVNGRVGFVGSRSKDAERAIGAALRNQPGGKLTLETETAWSPRRSLDVKFQVDGGAAETVVAVALVQASAENKVPRGENAGRTLRHHFVVRDFAARAPSKEGDGIVTLTAPKDVELSQFSVIAYAQRSGDGGVFAAAHRATPGSN